MRRWMTGLVLALLVLGLSPPLQVDRAAAFGREIAWLTIEDDLAIYHYGAGYAADVPVVQAWVREASGIVERVLGERLQYKANIYLYPSYESYGQGQHVVSSDPEGGWVMDLTPSLVTDPYQKSSRPRVWTHEWTHLVASQIRPLNDTPMWLAEGLADYVSIWGSENPEWIANAAVYEHDLVRAARDGDLSGFNFGNLYWRSAQVVRFMFETYGTERMRQFLRINTGDLQDDAREALGVTWEELRAAWFRWASAKTGVPLETVVGKPKQKEVPLTGPLYQITTIPVEYRRPLPVPLREPVQLTMQVGQPAFTVVDPAGQTAAGGGGGQRRTAAVAPMVQDGQVLVPLRAVGEALGAAVDWDPTTRKMSLTFAPEPNQARAQPQALTHSESQTQPPPRVGGTGEAGQYVRVPGDLIWTNLGGAAPFLWVYVATPEAIDPAELVRIVDGPKFAFRQFRLITAPDEARSRFGGRYAALVELHLPMVDEGNGTWRSRWPVVVRPRPDVDILLMGPQRLIPAGWTYTVNPGPVTDCGPVAPSPGGKE